jgi:hypothetical protein
MALLPRCKIRVSLRVCKLSFVHVLFEPSTCKLAMDYGARGVRHIFVLFRLTHAGKKPRPSKLMASASSKPKTHSTMGWTALHLLGFVHWYRSWVLSENGGEWWKMVKCSLIFEGWWAPSHFRSSFFIFSPMSSNFIHQQYLGGSEALKFIHCKE